MHWNVKFCIQMTPLKCQKNNCIVTFLYNSLDSLPPSFTMFLHFWRPSCLIKYTKWLQKHNLLWMTWKVLTSCSNEIIIFKAWFQIQWQLNCKQHFTSIYIMFDVFKRHSKMLKGRKLHLNIFFWQFIGYGFITAVMHQPRTLVTPQWAAFV